VASNESVHDGCLSETFTLGDDIDRFRRLLRLAWPDLAGWEPFADQYAIGPGQRCAHSLSAVSKRSMLKDGLPKTVYAKRRAFAFYDQPLIIGTARS
jgi:hypothetical protein